MVDEDERDCVSPITRQVDRARACLQGFSVTHLPVVVVTRTWTSGRVGIGEVSVEELAIEPCPRVRGMPRFAGSIQGTKIDGTRRVTGVSLRYRRDQLTSEGLQPHQERYLLIDGEEYRLSTLPEKTNTGWSFEARRMQARPAKGI